MTRADFLMNGFNILAIAHVDKLPDVYNDSLFQNSSQDEKYWNNIRDRFHLNKDIIDFRANAASPLPKNVLDFFKQEFTNIEAVPSVKNKGIEAGEKEALRVSISKEINCSAQEVAIMRNTTEALNNVIMGFPFKKGDEVVASVHEYDSMIAGFYQRKIKDGITIKQLDIPYQPQSKEQIIGLFENSITGKTKMFLLSHIIWISGQIYPIKEICEIARKNNIITVIDGAQSFSHIHVDVAELGCDYFGASLHKWCAAPLGTGFLYIKKDLISKTYPLMGSYKFLPDDEAIEKFESYGTVTPMFSSANVSVQFWRKFGLAAKMERMQFLKEYWTTKLNDIPNVEIRTNCSGENSCGIAYFEIKGKSATYVANQLWEKHKITVEAIENYKNNYVDYKGVNTVGVATPVFISIANLDKLINAVKNIR